MQGMKKSFLLYNRLLDDRLHGERKLDGQAIPMDGVDSCADDTSVIQTCISIAIILYCVRATYGAIALLLLSVYIVGAALVLLVPSRGLLKGPDSSSVLAPQEGLSTSSADVAGTSSGSLLRGMDLVIADGENRRREKEQRDLSWRREMEERVERKANAARREIEERVERKANAAEEGLSKHREIVNAYLAERRNGDEEAEIRKGKIQLYSQITDDLCKLLANDEELSSSEESSLSE